MPNPLQLIGIGLTYACSFSITDLINMGLPCNCGRHGGRSKRDRDPLARVSVGTVTTHEANAVGAECSGDNRGLVGIKRMSIESSRQVTRAKPTLQRYPTEQSHFFSSERQR